MTLTAGTAGGATGAAYLHFTREPGTATAGTPFGTQPIVSVHNKTGALVTVTATKVGLSVLNSNILTGCVATETSKGVVTFSKCEIDTAGTYYLIASLTGYTDAFSTTFTVQAGTPTALVFTRQPATITAGTDFATPPKLTVEDAYGNAVKAGTFKILLAAAKQTGQGALLTCTGGETQAKTTAPVYELTSKKGSASFGSCTIDKASTSAYHLVGLATVGTTTPLTVQSTGFFVNAGPPTKIVFTTNPTAALADQPFGVQPVVVVEDAAGNVVGATGTVVLSIRATSNPSTALLLDCTGGTVTGGIAGFSTCLIDKSGTGYELKASLAVGASTITGTSNSFTVSAGPAASLKFAAQPGTGTGGSLLSEQPVVEINTATGGLASGTVTLHLETSTGGTPPSGATLTCAANPAPAGTGVASFANCTVNEDGTYELVATDPDAAGATSAVSTTFTVRTGPAAQMVFTTSPSSSTGGVAFPTQPRVSVEDLGGNRVPTSTIDLGIAPGTGSSGATLTCTGGDQAKTSTGPATFKGCAVDLVGKAYQLGATSAGLTGDSSAFTVTLGSPARLEFTAEPSGGTVSTPFGGQPQVTVADAGGNPEPLATVGITLTSSTGTLNCLEDPVRTDSTGIAAFAGCKVTDTGTPTLTATGDGFTATSTTVSVVSGSPLGFVPPGTSVPTPQTFGAATLGTNPTSVTDDVNSATGALDLGYTDLTMAAVGKPFTLTRQYNSNDPTGGSFGPGWSSILDAGVHVLATGTTAVVRGINGQELQFTSSGTGTWTPPPGARASLSCLGTLCTVTQFDGTVFQSVGGKIQDYLSADGIGLHFIYSQGLLTEITGSAETLLTGVEASLRQQLDALSPTSTIYGDLTKVIATLGQALTTKLWVDGNDLSPTLGGQVLSQLKRATHELGKVATSSGWGSPTALSAPSVPDWYITALLDIGQALRIIDANAISENISEPQNPTALSAAEAHFATGDALLASGRFPAAFSAFAAAWKSALKANGSGQGSRVPLTISVTENPTGEVTAITTPTRKVRYTYTGTTHLLTSYTDPDGKTWTYSYTSTSGPLTQVTAPTGVPVLEVTYAGTRVAGASLTGSQKHFVDTYTWTSTTQVSTRSSLVELSAGGPTATATYLDEYQGNVLLAQQVPDGATTSYAYDANLDLVGVQDPLGRVDTMTYDSAGDLLTQTTPAYGGPAVASFTYNASHQVLTTTDANGNTTTNAYTGANLVAVTSPALTTGRPDTTSYRTNYLGEVYEVTGPTATLQYAYDAAGNRTGFQVLDPQGHPLDGLGPVFSYNEAGQTTVLTDPRGHTATSLTPLYQTRKTYNPDGELSSTTSPGKGTTTTTYTPAGSVLSVSEPTTGTTTYRWNESTLQLTATGPFGTSTISTYGPSGNLLAQTGPSGATTAYTYDTTGRQLSKTGPTGVTTFYRYDLEGNPVAASTSTGHSASYTYDSANDVISSTVNGVKTSTTYDAAGNVTSQTDGDARRTTFTYNSHDLPASVTTAAGTTSYQYDLAGNLIAVTDANGHTITYGVNGVDERTSMTVAGNKTSYAYDAAGNLVETTDPDGRTTTYTVSPLDLRTHITYTQTGHPTINVAQTFNAAGKPTSVTESTSTPSTQPYKTTFTYNTSGDLTKVTDGSSTYAYTYATPGKMIETYPDGTTVTYAYDDAHSLMGVSTTTGLSVSYLRNAQRQVTVIAYSNGILQSQAYDANGLMTSMSLSCAGATELTQATRFDAYGAPLSILTKVGKTTTTHSFGYDTTGRTDAQSTTTSTTPATTALPNTGCTTGVQVSTPAGNDGSGSTSAFTTPPNGSQPISPTAGTPGYGTSAHQIAYDAVGNITSIGGTTISYTAANEVKAEGGTNPVSYTYDHNGDVTSKTVGTKTTRYSYNAADQLVRVTGPTTEHVTYAYDGLGNRVSKTVNGTTTDYSWDLSTTLPLLTLICSGACSTGSKVNVVDQFVYGVGPVAMQTQTATYYLHENQQGDVVAVSNAKGAILETYRYDALGNVTATKVGTSPPPNEPLLFQSQFLTATTGLYDMRARNYDPASGTFTQRDPAAPAVGAPVLSPYVYANDQATASADPTGNTSVSGMAESVYYGHSTATADKVGVTRLGIAAVLGVRAVARTIGRYAVQAEEEAAAKVAANDPPEYFANDWEYVDESAGVVGSSSDLVAALTVGAKVLAVAGFALGIYLTVEDCQHGPLAQCVGDSVGLALGLACAVAGETAAVGLTFGAATPLVMAGCGAVAGVIGLVISMYGPQIVQGLSDFGQYVAEGATYVFDALQRDFKANGATLTGPFFRLAAVVLLGPAALLLNEYNVNGVLATGFNELANYVSSGFESVLSTLEKSGETAAELASALEKYFGQRLDAIVNELITRGFDVDAVAFAIEVVFGVTPLVAAEILQEFQYDVPEIASALDHAYHETAAFTAQVLQDIGAGASAIFTSLRTVFTVSVEAAAAILKGLGITVDEIARVLGSIETALQAANVLYDLTYSVDLIAGAVGTAYSYSYEAVGEVLNQVTGITQTAIAQALVFVYTVTTPATLAQFFKTTLGDGAAAVAGVVESAFGEAVSTVVGLLKTLGFSITTIEKALTAVFHLTATQMISALQTWFTNTLIASLGGALTSALSTYTTTVAGFFSTTLF